MEGQLSGERAQPVVGFRRNKELFAAFHPTVFFMPSLKKPKHKKAPNNSATNKHFCTSLQICPHHPIPKTSHTEIFLVRLKFKHPGWEEASIFRRWLLQLNVICFHQCAKILSKAPAVFSADKQCLCFSHHKNEMNSQYYWWAAPTAGISVLKVLLPWCRECRQVIPTQEPGREITGSTTTSHSLSRPISTKQNLLDPSEFRIWEKPCAASPHRCCLEENGMIWSLRTSHQTHESWLHNQRTNQYRITNPTPWFYRLTNNSTFFLSPWPLGFAGRGWALSLPLQDGVTPSCCLWLSLGLWSPGAGPGCWGWQGLGCGAESSCSGVTEAAPPCSPSLSLCCWRAFSRCNCFRVLGTAWGRGCCCWGCEGSYKSVGGETGLKTNLSIKDRLLQRCSGQAKTKIRKKITRQGVMGRQCGGNLRKLERFCKPKIQEFSMILLSLSEEREELEAWTAGLKEKP